MKAVILAGGSGTRLWPLSTKAKPKQFQKIISEKTMLEETIDRLDFLKNEDIYIAFNQDHLELIKQLCPQIPAKNLIIEPDLRDTSSCIGFATAIIAKDFPDEVIAIIYADQLILDKAEFQEKIGIAAEISQKEDLITIVEVEAREPNTHYGYVKYGELIENRQGTEIYSLEKFTEKPDFQTAIEFVASGKYFWNTGIYLFKAKLLLDHYKNLQPETYKKLEEIQESLGTDREKSTITTVYPTLEKISIDYAIMERIAPTQIRLIKANFGWSDIGNWEAIWELSPKDHDQNIYRGDTSMIDCKNCLIYSDSGKKIAAIGLEDTVIVDTEDGLIVCKKEHSIKIKEII